MNLIPLFLLPIFGGFIYCVNTRKIKHFIDRQSDQRLYFSSASYGIVLSLLAAEIHIIIWLYFPTEYLSIIELANDFAFNLKSSVRAGETKGDLSLFCSGSIAIICLMAFLIGVILPYAANIPYALHEIDEEKLINRAEKDVESIIDRYKNENAISVLYKASLELNKAILFLKDWGTKVVQKRNKELSKQRELDSMLIKSMEKSCCIMVTLETRQVYTGHILKMSPTHDEDKYIRILPILSGYRDEKTMSVRFTTDYQPAYDKIIKDKTSKDEGEFSHINIDDFEVIIYEKNITSAHLFDKNLYEKLYNNGSLLTAFNKI
ncbi:hypothetical protein [Pleionea sp. CnH1-48]|uniref:hypothetical protein n=1 Tax=Pleionea sp. CnH1-48 TaxID=2954494 RepID=UPI002096C74F|nr:hypothetical protein [Pleionea sp. CnH1-48]MCO7227433.1 hypothetical protein [Pleionea sp. CnH1-48]